MMVDSRHLVSLSEPRLLPALTSENRWPNLLVVCRDVTVEAVVRHLVGFCEPPYHLITLPGTLDLPEPRKGTLLLTDVATLSLAQQVELYDWLTGGCEHLQVVSISSVPLRPLVDDGRFLEGLFYRLNVIYLDARPGRPEARQRVN